MKNAINGYILSNSIVHKTNPSIKLMIFIAFVIIVFLPTGLVFQLITISIISTIFMISKLPFKIYWSTLKTIIIMFLFLFLINWFTYRNPGFLNISSVSNQHNYLLIGNYEDKIVANLYDYDFFSKNQFPIFNSKTKMMISFGDVLNIVQQKRSDLTFEQVQQFFKISVPKVAGADLVQFSFNPDSLVLKPEYFFNWYALSFKTLFITLSIVLKIFMMVLLATILTSSSTSIELTFGIEQLLSPLKLLKVPVNSLAMTISISIRFVPSLLLESQRILNAQASRGIDFKNGNFIERLRSLISLIIPMVSIAFRNAGELANAMDARSYNPRFARTRYRIFKVHALDLFVYTILMIILGFFIFVASSRIFFGVFGSPEWMVIGLGANVGQFKS
ncbi:energy-coupling factor transporter transmembrane component T [Mycoplasma bradburyae]|uniref:Energy-coupling factor transporter transmembrane protein EcfT n=1 Tax=Mycoplasma bradburyae TaxID=2963128 RepID=A0AAW6HQL7_9MOLU|nr:energy-coupling factor transporter transmembrane component T [Mycoplasma bradburyae]MDC4163560.1 energy-coupling factor transporter transmembrane protein EcfT [Mycoplasma bradburyae]MDC4182158.1 energy-coupling factor transporter transmembrane protein EcfT [Mycoplasma bradburyae]MDC4182923.1 energy-coupling factor transporter transmembrane protein EcfT [Mycoplasma bradburyae]MDC4183606.1 energy-coupling factor transporter transmembrane protein EcfT [Mycoplasma bradburyae]MDC4184344.1 energy